MLIKPEPRRRLRDITMNHKQVALGVENRCAIKALMASHLGISRQEIAERLNLSAMAVTRHVAAIRAE